MSILSAGTFVGTRKGCKEGLSVSIPQRIILGNTVLIPQQDLDPNPNPSEVTLSLRTKTTLIFKCSKTIVKLRGLKILVAFWLGL